MPYSDPYAAPRTDNFPPPDDIPWYTEDITVFVRDGALLPPVDLETGHTSEGLVEVKRSLMRGGASFFYWGLMPLLIPKANGEWLRNIGISYQVLIPALMVLLGLHVSLFIFRPSLFGKCVRFRMSVSRESVKNAKRRRVLLLAGLLFSAVSMFIPILFFYLKSDMRLMMKIIFPSMFTGMAGMIACMIWQLRNLPKVRFKGFSGKYLQITGSSPEALAHLRAIKTNRNPP